MHRVVTPTFGQLGHVIVDGSTVGVRRVLLTLLTQRHKVTAVAQGSISACKASDLNAEALR